MHKQIEVKQHYKMEKLKQIKISLRKPGAIYNEDDPEPLLHRAITNPFDISMMVQDSGQLSGRVLENNKEVILNLKEPEEGDPCKPEPHSSPETETLRSMSLQTSSDHEYPITFSKRHRSEERKVETCQYSQDYDPDYIHHHDHGYQQH